MDRRWLLLPIAWWSLAAHAVDALPLSCPACHGDADDEGAIPSLETLTPSAIEQALIAFRDRARPGTAMPRIAATLSDDEIRRLAAAVGRTR